MRGDSRRHLGEPVPVVADCPECGSEETRTSGYAASHADDLDRLSAWCETCGHSFGAESLEGGSR